MTDADLIFFCTNVGDLCELPVRLYRNGKLMLFHSLAPLPYDIAALYGSELSRITAHIGYYITPALHYFGIVNAGPVRIVLGPTAQVPDSTQSLHELAFRMDVPDADKADFIASMKRIGRMPLERLLQLLCTLNFILNDERKGIADIAIFETEQSALKRKVELQRSRSVFEKESAPAPGGYALEQALMSIVRKGDTAALKTWIAAAPAVRGGVIAQEQLRQIKNTFIVTATLVSRAAIRGGMDEADAFSLSDTFISGCEPMQEPDRITNLQYRMVLEFTERVERLHLGSSPTGLTRDVSNYIQHHLSEAITVANVAKELYLSRPYLSKRFRAETGKTMTDYILNEKTEEAKRLLRYTDKSLSAIASYLGFSSQSHFARVFKKYAGCTPGEYKDD